MQDDRGLEFAICDCSLLWRKLYSKHTNQLGLLGLERRVILVLHEHQLITQVKLAEKLEIEPQGLTRILDRMEAKGTIAKQASPTDRRAKCLQLTKAGLELYRQILEIADGLRPNILAGLSPNDVDKLQTLLDGIKLNLEHALSDG